LTCQCGKSLPGSSLDFSSQKSSTTVIKESSKDEQVAQNFNKTLLMIMQMMVPKILRVLANQSLEAAHRIANGQTPIPLDYKKRWVEQLTNAQKVDTVTALSAGWTVAGGLVDQAPNVFNNERVTGIENEPASFTPMTLSTALEHIWMLSDRSVDTHARKIQKYQQKVEEGTEDPKEIAAGTLVLLETWDQTQANLITQYVTVWAGNEGLMRRYKASGVTAFRWYTMLDERVCSRCFSLHGKIVVNNQPFWEANVDKVIVTEDGEEVTLRGPAFTTYHPALHARCRCFLMPVIINM